ncbi:c-type cytochrome [Sorangium cellulosum]|uniref:Cytochrome c n=1 Tax=Sorangium cellulosum TaxID=56 RepID=A0A150Q2N9_SORCE|nr:cytochrome c [Sorangium cellulosum]KYF62232.1 cytochrome c precursor [Sorangium cellulosum]
MGTASKRDDARGGEQNTAHVVVILLIVAFGVLALPWMVLRKLEGRALPPGGGLGSGATADDLAQGGKIYYRSCTSCHQARGEGKPGRYPPLVGTSWLLDDAETPIRLLLLGATGPMEVNGVVYNDVMPNLGVTLSDEEIALVLTYVRSSWGNSAPAITEVDVARVRASLGDRQAPWAGGAELAAARATRVLP